MRLLPLFIVVLCLACGARQDNSPPIRADLPAAVAVTDPAGLNGTWAVVVELATILTLPVLGDRNAGSQQLWLHTRTWDAAANVYQERAQWCAIDVWEVEGNKLSIPDTTLQKHAPMVFTSTLDGPRGFFRIPTLLDVWGLRNLPDPENTPLPTRHDFTQSPQQDWIFDEDEDGKLATTGNTTGITGGEVYQVVRGLYTFEGSVVTPDRIQGLVEMRRYEQNVLDATNSLAKGEGIIRQDPDQGLTWFDMVRLPEGSLCPDVLAAQRNGTLATRRPF